MGNLLQHMTTLNALRAAWSRVRQNGLTSSAAAETRSQIAWFEQDAERNLRRIQKRLREGTFEFAPQKGVLKQKAHGKGLRGIVMASVHNRIIERALLDCLQENCDFVKQVIHLPTSVGGVPERSVPHGLAEIQKAFESGKQWFARSDISGFFDNIARRDVLATIAQQTDDARFMSVLEQATTVVLGNEKSLGEDRRCFPTDELGVAQGSPLSPLFGNILLSEFDTQFNDRGIICVRFIDDFVLLGETQAKVAKAFDSAQAYLGRLGLRCHDPFLKGADSKKAECGPAKDGFVFLGYRIEPGLYQPSAKARKKILAAVDDHIQMGRRGILDCIREANSFANRQRYVQTMDLIDRMLKGWANAFAFSNSISTLADLDRAVDEKLERFRKWFTVHIASADQKQRRRAVGVCLLADVKPKSLTSLPFAVSGQVKRFRQSSKTLTVSTDGSVIAAGKRRHRNSGPGGWACVVHETGETFFGSCSNVTNNQMELRAVLEGLRRLPKNKTLKIRTDSQYVEQTFNRRRTVTNNLEMWQELQAFAAERAFKIVWVKGHDDDEYNTLADMLANKAAKRLEQSGRGKCAA